MSTGELRRKLIQKGEPPYAADDAVEFLVECGFLDDAEYAALVVRHYSAKGYNDWRIRQELRRHLVPPDYWNDALDSL
jgi:regulatory protein